ncbi:MAG: RlmE family RNA methyltransferase, partial [bacterium]
RELGDLSENSEYHEAKEQGFLARSVFKLQEIDQKYRLFPNNRKEPLFVIDLGCAPGSWLQYVIPKLSVDDKVVGIDLNEIDISDERLVFIQGDILETSPEEFREAAGATNGFNLVLSDMAPKTCGIKSVDQERSIELCRAAMDVAIANLKKNGSLVIKAFQSNEVKPFTETLKKHFREVKIFKPESSRQESFEIFIIAIGRL